MNTLTYQDLIALALVAWAVAHVAHRLWQFGVRGVPTGCVGCKGCPSAQQPALISLGGLEKNRTGLPKHGT